MKLLALLTFLLRSGFFVVQNIFDDLELKRSSTWMELKSVSFALKRVAPIFRNSSLKLCTENKAVAFITDSGSIKLYLNAAVAEVSLCFSSAHVIRLSMERIPLTLNRKLIVAVRSLIMVTGMFPTLIFMKWILFTSYANTKLPRFYSN